MDAQANTTVEGWTTVGRGLAGVFSALLSEELDRDDYCAVAAVPASTPDRKATTSPQPLACKVSAWRGIGRKLASVFRDAAREMKSEASTPPLCPTYCSECSTSADTASVGELSDSECSDCDTRTPELKCQAQSEIQAWEDVGARLANVLSAVDSDDDEDGQSWIHQSSRYLSDSELRNRSVRTPRRLVQTDFERKRQIECQINAWSGVGTRLATILGGADSDDDEDLS